jgi:hypothetical protein
MSIGCEEVDHAGPEPHHAHHPSDCASLRDAIGERSSFRRDAPRRVLPRHQPQRAAGYASIVNPVTTYDLHATVLYLLGIDHKRLTFDHDVILRRLTNVHGNVVKAILP